MIPYALLAFAALLGLLFRQTKYTHLGVLVSAVLFSADRFPATHTLSLGLAAYVLPVNLVLYGMLPESALATRDGIVRSICAIIQSVVLVTLAGTVSPATGSAWFTGSAFGLPIHLAVIWLLAVPQILILYSGNRLSSFARLFPLLAMWGLVTSASPIYEGIPRLPAALPFFAATVAVAFIYAATEYTWRSAHLDELTELPSRRSLMHTASPGSREITALR
ncbi:MAG: hypothetical protein O2901_12615 [Verrucomicrobia bacterium]|nr:hypothetical protein [Verrucomicrobiota bacterium]